VLINTNFIIGLEENQSTYADVSAKYFLSETTSKYSSHNNNMHAGEETYIKGCVYHRALFWSDRSSNNAIRKQTIFA
jgi:hypothetical protein